MKARIESRPAGVAVAVLMHHAPILVPPVGGERGREARSSVAALRAAAGTVVASRPDAVVVLSPHSPRRHGAYGVWRTPALEGSFAAFGSPGVGVRLPVDEPLVEALGAEASEAGVPMWELLGGELDHGALVPLWFLVEAGWKGPTVVMALSDPGAPGRSALGRAIATAAVRAGRRVAVVASGDMSHRLQPGAPGGYDPRAARFDREFIERLRTGDIDGAVHLDPALRELAGEDVVDSTAIAAAALPPDASAPEVLSYEGPFGVGYGVAVLGVAGDASPPDPGPTGTPAPQRMEDLPAVARRSIAAALDGIPGCPPPGVGPLAGRRAAFVTLRGPDGSLRGCIGTLTPQDRDVVAETWRMARQAALHDPRFDPVHPSELPDLRIEVSVLHPPEPVDSTADLDPSRYGVIVNGRGGRRGVLLPGIEGVDTPEQQVAIARRKAGLDPEDPVVLERFRVDHASET